MDACKEERYTVKVVFRGLFVASVKETTIDVLLPDARLPGRAIADSQEPLRTLLSSLQPLREHHAAIEFPLADWDNRSRLLPRLVHLHKPTKEPVALYLLDQQSISFGPLYDERRNPRDAQPPEVLKEERELYSRLGNDLLLLRHHPSHGFDQLPVFNSDLRPDTAKVCVATAAVDVGEVFTERRSLRGFETRLWRSRSVLNFVGQEARDRLHLPDPPADVEPRPLNLDLVVRFSIPITNPFQIMCRSFEPGPVDQFFILRPSDPRRELTVWIKNRELEAILRDSDLVPDPFIAPPDHGDATDRDHANFLRLALNPAGLKVPRDNSDEASDSGSGCGGTGH